MSAKMPRPSFTEALPVLDTIRQTVDLHEPQTLHDAMNMYLDYCSLTGFFITNKSLYYALRVSRDCICKWANGSRKAHDPRYREFANLARQVCSAAREQYGVEGQVNPILTIWHEKFYDGFTDNPQPEKTYNPLDMLPDAGELIRKWGLADD